MKLSDYTLDELIEMRDMIENHINDFEDGFVYICKVRSYGRNWVVNIKNIRKLEDLCYQYSGDDGIVDIYSTNPNIFNVNNYGDLAYIESVEDYNQWKGYKSLEDLIGRIEYELSKPRPTFKSPYSIEDLENYKKRLNDYDMSFIPPVFKRYED
jgi:hypothetical protein